ncbi:MAG TPA: undecaprenyldiphospho-muramoylpentapeptide beta-N-acetylglucosaminyltransferase [Firmicutes bacterium]|nr:undecaprenyldiphospho-muramoylpentapeptide beta-N-acetylglucosaminyltransferase [Bacillota bacterium]
MRVVFAGGGTGGHIYPAITIARVLRERHPDSEILFVGSRRGPDSDIVTREGFEIKTIDMTGIPRRVSLRSVLAAFKAASGLTKAFAILTEFRPDVAIGTGGYISGPVLLAARLMGVPVAIQEQNVVPGFANRVLSRLARAVFVSFEESRPYFPRSSRVLVTGNPVRREIVEKGRTEGAEALGLDPGRPTLLVFGGSLGAGVINEAMCEAYPSLMKIPGLQVVHQTGPAGYDATRSKLVQRGIIPKYGGDIVLTPYLYDMASALASADLVVMRAGGGVAEITARGLPAILVPLSGAPGAHQAKNAEVLRKAGAALVICQEGLNGEVLFHAVKSLLSSPARLAEMAGRSRALGKPDAALEIVREIEAIVAGRGR